MTFLPPGIALSPGTPDPAVPHAYPLLLRDAGLASAIGLLLRTLPYAIARFAVLLAAALGIMLWAAVAIGGAAWLGTHIAGAFGWAWLLLCLLALVFAWRLVLRYFLHLVACGHVAVLTELITRGAVGNGAESMFAYGRRIVTERIGEVTLLFGLNAAVRGVVQAFHRTLDWLAEVLPIPGLEGLSRLFDIVLRAASRYLDKVIFSYDLARGGDPWEGARQGLVYYCQNARPILKTSIWIVILERLLTVVLWLALLAPAAAIVLLMPAAMRNLGAIATLGVAALLAGSVRSAFLKPIFLIMIMVRFHALIEHQPINAQWEARLAEISDRFRGLSQPPRPAAE